jgi:uncharacterized protein YdcH (DUF465 family)
MPFFLPHFARYIHIRCTLARTTLPRGGSERTNAVGRRSRMSDTEAQLFARLKEESPEFRRLAEKHREFDIKIGEFDRIYYLTSEQERKRKELQKLKLKIKDEMYVIMRQFQHVDQEQEVVSS